jgi:hypothetical protein
LAGEDEFPDVAPEPDVIAVPEIATDKEEATPEPLVPVAPVTSQVRSVSACVNEVKTKKRRNEGVFILTPLDNYDKIPYQKNFHIFL